MGAILIQSSNIYRIAGSKKNKKNIADLVVEGLGVFL